MPFSSPCCGRPSSTPPLTVLLPYLLGTSGVFVAEAASQFLGGLACFTTMYFVVYRPLGRLELAER